VGNLKVVSDLDFYKYMRESKTKDGVRVRMMKRLMKRVVRSMEWMVADMDYKNQLNDQPEDSPELTEAKDVLCDMKNYLERD
jgi:hypothetical protein